MDLYMWEWSATPLIIFHEGDFLESHQSLVRSFTWRRAVSFAYVNWTQFPTGFNPETYQEKWDYPHKGPHKWGYNQMIRFWVTRIWHHPAIRGYTALVRLDSDSCLTKPFSGFYLPRGSNYLSWRASYECGTYSNGEAEFAEKYLKDQRLEVADPVEWERRGAEVGCVPAFYNNFEVTRVAFFQREDVAKFQLAITDTEPYGVFGWRWGDAAIRWFTLTLFSPPGTVTVDRYMRYFYSHTCDPFHLFEIVGLVLALALTALVMLLPIKPRWRHKILVCTRCSH